MNPQQQFVVANYLGASLVVIGVVVVGMGTGFWLAVQTMLGAGCEQTIGMQPTACQLGMQTLSTRSVFSILVGAGSLASGGGIMWYLRRVVP